MGWLVASVIGVDHMLLSAPQIGPPHLLDVQTEGVEEGIYGDIAGTTLFASLTPSRAGQQWFNDQFGGGKDL